MGAILECVPNFSEGRDLAVIEAIAGSIRRVSGVKLLHIDPGAATNRTVMTLAGDPEAVIEAAFQAIKTASEKIDMRNHHGEHPRMGATDVCPLIPVSGITMAEAVNLAKRLGQRVGQELGIPVYLYEYAATAPHRKNLAAIRAGEYEGFVEKIKDPLWQPDYGPAVFNPTAGQTVIGARDFLIAYNLNLNTRSVRRANSIAFDLREAGRVKRQGHPVVGAIVRDETGQPVTIPGLFKGLKAIGWYIEEYGIAQVSINITNIATAPLHKVFEAGCECATKRGLRVTGSELVGLVPLKVMLDAGRYFLQQQHLSDGVSETELIHIAVKSMGLDALAPFDPKVRIIEYALTADKPAGLAEMTLTAFADLTASDAPAPGGGSVSAYIGGLGAALAAMVANLTANKAGNEPLLTALSGVAVAAQSLKDKLLMLTDADTAAFNKIMEAFKLSKGNDAEKTARSKAILAATVEAIRVPLTVMETALAAYPLLEAMIRDGNPASISDVGVGILACHAAIHGAYLNVRINAASRKEPEILSLTQQAEAILADSQARHQTLLQQVIAKIG